MSLAPGEKYPCILDNEPGTWGEWTKCSKSCDGGVQTRRRECDSGQPCSGTNNKNRQRKKCNQEKCGKD